MRPIGLRMFPIIHQNMVTHTLMLKGKHSMISRSVTVVQ